MVVMPRKVLPVDEQVVVLVQLPELAVDDVEVLVAEEVGHLERRKFYESIFNVRLKEIHKTYVIRC